MAYDKTTIFQNIGKGVKKFNKIDTPESGFKAVLDSVMSEIVSLYNDSEAERRILNLFSNANRSDQATLDSIKSQTVSIVSSFLTTVVREAPPVHPVLNDSRLHLLNKTTSVRPWSHDRDGSPSAYIRTWNYVYKSAEDFTSEQFVSDLETRFQQKP